MSMLKFGVISEVDEQKGLSRVKFLDQEIVSGWLPVLQKNTLKNQDECWMDVNEHVVCLMDENLEHGVILGAIYSDGELPVVKDKNVRAVKFEDGSFIKFNRTSKKLTVSCEGDVEIIKATNVNIVASAKITLDSDVEITGKLTVANDIESETGEIKATVGDVKAGPTSVSLLTHVHAGVTSGMASTSPPTP